MQQQTNLNEKTSILQALKESPFVSETYIQPYRHQKQIQDEDLLQYEDQTKPQQLSNEQQQYQPLESYIISKTLGKGNFGKVKLAMHKLTQQYVAVKILQKDLIFQNTDIVRITRELKIMKKLRHPFVVQLYQIIETAKQLYLIMEYAEGGDLFQKIVNEERIKQTQAARIYTQIVLGMDYFHSKGVTHRDLKPQNILMSKDGTIKIADFGLGNMFKPQEKLKTACGSPCYASPQMLNRESYDPKKIDIWSSGIILYAMVCGYLPFEDQVTAKLYEKIKTSNVKLPSWVSSPCRNLIRGLLTKDPKLRFDVESILSHEMITPHLQSLKQMIKERQLTENKIQEICEMYDIEEKEKLLSDLNKNRHNNLTTLYYLAVKRIDKQEKEKPLYYEKDMKQNKRDKEQNLQSKIVQQLQQKQQSKAQMKSQQVDQGINRNEINEINGMQKVQMMQQVQTHEQDKEDKCRDEIQNKRNQQQQIRDIRIDENSKNIQSEQKVPEQYKQQEVQTPSNQLISNQPQPINKDQYHAMQIEQHRNSLEDREVNEYQGEKNIQDDDKDEDRRKLGQQKMKQQQEQNILSDEQLEMHRIQEEGNYQLEDIHFNELMEGDNQERIRDRQQQQQFLEDSQTQMDKIKDSIDIKGDQDIEDQEEMKMDEKVEDKVEDRGKQVQQLQQHEQQHQRQGIPQQQRQEQEQIVREQGYSGPESIIQQSYQLSMEIQKTLQQLNQMTNLQTSQQNVNVSVSVNDRLLNINDRQNTYNNQQTHLKGSEISHIQQERADQIQNDQHGQLENVRNEDMQSQSNDKMQSEQINALQTNKVSNMQVNNDKVTDIQKSQLNHENKDQQHIHPQSMSIEQQQVNHQVTDNHLVINQLVQEDSKESQKLTEAHLLTITQHIPQTQLQHQHQPQPQHQQIHIQQNNESLQQVKPNQSQAHQRDPKQQAHQRDLKQQVLPDQVNNQQIQSDQKQIIQPEQINNQQDYQPQNDNKQRYQMQAQTVNNDQQDNFIEQQQQPIKFQSIGSNIHLSHQTPNTQIITTQSQSNHNNQQIHIRNQPSQLTTNLPNAINNESQTNPLEQQQQQQPQQQQQQIPSNIQKTSLQFSYQFNQIPHQQHIDLQQAQLIQQIQIIQTVIYKKQPQKLNNNTTKLYTNPDQNQLKNSNHIQVTKPQNKLLRQNNKKNHLFSTDQVLPLKQQTQKLNQKQLKSHLQIQNRHQPVNSKIQVKNILAARNIRLNQRSHSKDTPIIFKSNKNKPTLKPQPIKDNKKNSLSKQKYPKFNNKPLDPKQKKSQQKQSNSNKMQKKQLVRQKFVIAKDKKPQKKQKFTSKEQSKVKSTETLKYEKKTAIQKSQKQDQKMFKTIGITAIKQQPQSISNKVESKSRLKSTSLISESSKRFSGYGIKYKKNANDQSKQHNIPISPISGIKTKEVSTPFNSIKLAFQHQHKTLVSNLKQQEEQNSSPLSQKEKEKSEVKKIQICKPKTFYENVKTKSFSQYSNMSSTLTNNSSSKIGISKYSQNSPGQSKLNKTIGSFSHRSKESDMKQRSLLSSQKQKIFDNFGIKSNTKFHSQFSQSNLESKQVNSKQVNNQTQNDFVINFSHTEPQLINPELIIFVSVQELYHLIESISQSKNNTFSNIIGTLSVYQYPTKDYMYVLNSNLFKSQQMPVNNKKSQAFSHKKSSPCKKRTKIGTFEFVQLINSIVLND